jgi:hypothetical protein
MSVGDRKIIEGARPLEVSLDALLAELKDRSESRYPPTGYDRDLVKAASAALTRMSDDLAAAHAVIAGLTGTEPLTLPRTGQHPTEGPTL